MLQNLAITESYFRQYRQELGFSNQTIIRNFFGAKDIVPVVDFNHIKLLNVRLYEIVDRVNNVVATEIKPEDLTFFKSEHIDKTFKIMQASNILPILNNQGRRPEQVYFSWMRGYVISNFFLKALGLIFEVDTSRIDLIGDDDLRNVETFRRTPKADIEINMSSNEKIRIEMQSGFTGTNDIKQHKVLEARRVYSEKGVQSLALHFDLYNGQVAFIRLDQIDDNDVNWITRQQMEGQTVFNIDQNYFVWKITDTPIKYKQINFGK